MQNSRILLEKSNDKYRQCRIPGIVLTDNGTLLAYYECRKELSDWADIDLKIIRSTDGGDTWSVVDIISGDGNTLNNPMMVVCKDRILFLYCKNYKQLFIQQSIDDGKTFSEPVVASEVFEKNIPFYNAVAIGPGHGILHNGNILVPIWYAYNKEDAISHRPSNVAVIYSKDNGKSWDLGEIIGQRVLINPSESALAIIDDGRVLISMRNENSAHKRAIAISNTGYDNWTDLHFAETLTDPICQGSVDSDRGMLFHINCDCETERKNLCLKISNNAFVYYEKIFIDEEGGYSDIAVSDDCYYIIYERDIDNDGLYFIKIRR